ncbi:MAG: helix-turn-helix domain-containing protein, partial [Steroidobacteraceae bacterium]|nr:helix-turn-helix domain-containing protein [Steroidobacteraceae bacterium]
MTETAGLTAGPGIGAQLRAARERAGLTTLQAAAKLHLEPRMIEALEAEEFAAIGAAVYVRGHLRRYAELVDAPVGPLLDAYAARDEASTPPDLHRKGQAETIRPSRELAGPVVG